MKYYVVPFFRVIFAILWLLFLRPLVIFMYVLAALWEWDTYDLHQKWHGPFFEYCNQSDMIDVGGYPGVYDEYYVYRTFSDLALNRRRIRKEPRY